MTTLPLPVCPFLWRSSATHRFHETHATRALGQNCSTGEMLPILCPVQTSSDVAPQVPGCRCGAFSVDVSWLYHMPSNCFQPLPTASNHPNQPPPPLLSGADNVTCSSCRTGWTGTNCTARCPRSAAGIPCAGHGACTADTGVCQCTQPSGAPGKALLGLLEFLIRSCRVWCLCLWLFAFFISFCWVCPPYTQTHPHRTHRHTRAHTDTQ